MISSLACYPFSSLLTRLSLYGRGTKRDWAGSREAGVLHHPNPRGVDEHETWGYIVDTRVSVINSRPRWRTVEHILFATVELILSPLSLDVLALAHGNLCGDEGGGSTTRRSLAGYTQESLPLKYRSGFLRVPGNVLRSLLTHGRAWLIYRVSVFAGFPGKCDRRRADAY